ncbi:DUF3696 domain-containing protein [Desulfococcaceae bacterium HSG7]|nr:DUF3696 domain-containing protein [Desulfococcaceae bacterium HSG7]
MIEEISLENFKAFKELDGLNIKPITILCGTNSCGKSSILQSILTFKQTLESQNLSQTLLLNGRFTHLGSFENIIYDKNVENVVSFGFKFNLKKQAINISERSSYNFSILFSSLLHELIPISKFDDTTECRLHYQISLSTSESSEKFYLKPITVNNLAFNFEALSNGVSISEASLEFILKDQNNYQVIWKNLFPLRYQNDDETSEGEETVQIEFSNLSPRIINTGSPPFDKEFKEFLRLALYMGNINDMLRYVFSSYSYIGPLREEPSRRYIYEDEIVEIGIKGENAAHIFLAEKERTIKNHYFYDKMEDSFFQKEEICLSDGVQDWLDSMNIKSLKSEPLREIIHLKLDAGVQNRTRVNIADVGFGVSQVFPIILEGLRMPVGNTLILEQPEIHLHPKLQMQIADYCIALALSGKKVIAETHSDHVVNRLVRRIVEDETGKLQELIGIYFIKPSQDGALFEEIVIDEKRGIVNWPEEFFDQFSSEQQKIMRAGLSKRKRLRKKESGLQ